MKPHPECKLEAFYSHSQCGLPPISTGSMSSWIRKAFGDYSAGGEGVAVAGLPLALLAAQKEG